MDIDEDKFFFLVDFEELVKVDDVSVIGKRRVVSLNILLF